MLPVRLLAGMLRARAMLEGKAAVRAVELKSCRNLRRSVAMGRASLKSKYDCEVRLDSRCCSDVTGR
jgi:hypothetical protein